MWWGALGSGFTEGQRQAQADIRQQQNDKIVNALKQQEFEAQKRAFADADLQRKIAVQRAGQPPAMFMPAGNMPQGGMQIPQGQANGQMMPPMQQQPPQPYSPIPNAPTNPATLNSPVTAQTFGLPQKQAAPQGMPVEPTLPDSANPAQRTIADASDQELYAQAQSFYPVKPGMSDDEKLMSHAGVQDVFGQLVGERDRYIKRMDDDLNRRNKLSEIAKRDRPDKETGDVAFAHEYGRLKAKGSARTEEENATFDELQALSRKKEYIKPVSTDPLSGRSSLVSHQLMSYEREISPVRDLSQNIQVARQILENPSAFSAVEIQGVISGLHMQKGQNSMAYNNLYSTSGNRLERFGQMLNQFVTGNKTTGYKKAVEQMLDGIQTAVDNVMDTTNGIYTDMANEEHINPKMLGVSPRNYGSQADAKADRKKADEKSKQELSISFQKGYKSTKENDAYVAHVMEKAKDSIKNGVSQQVVKKWAIERMKNKGLPVISDE